MQKKHKLKVAPEKGQVKVRYRCQSAEFSIDDAKQAIIDLVIAVDEAQKYEPVFSDRVEELYQLMDPNISGIRFSGWKLRLSGTRAYRLIEDDYKKLELLRDRINAILEEFAIMGKQPIDEEPENDFDEDDDF